MAKARSKGRDDARKQQFLQERIFPSQIAFDHGQIIEDYFDILENRQETGSKVTPAL